MSETEELCIEYSPRQWQLDFHNRTERWAVLVLHRRAWKTVSCVNELIRCAVEKEWIYAYIAPTYKQAKNIAWDLLKNFLRPLQEARYVKFNESELKADFVTGSRIQLFGADNPDSLRWLWLSWVVFDEYSQQPSSIFREIIWPALADNKGWAVWIGTPKWKNAFYDLYVGGLQDPNWYTLKLKASASWLLDYDELNSQRKNMTVDEYEQEFECNFDAAVRWAIYANELSVLHDQKRIIKGLYDPLLEVSTVWDIGVWDSTAIIFIQISDQRVHIVDYYEDHGFWLDHYAKVLQWKDYRYGWHYFPHDIKVRDFGTWLSRLEVAKKLFGSAYVHIVPQLSLKEGIDAARLNFHDFWFESEKTDELINALTQYQQEWDDRKGMFKEKPKHDWTSHAADAFRYCAIIYKMITQRRIDNKKKRLWHRVRYNPITGEVMNWKGLSKGKKVLY